MGKRVTDAAAGKGLRTTWSDLANGDVGEPFLVQQAARTVQVGGHFGVGGSVQIEGTLIDEPEDDDWCILNDVQGNPLVFTAGRIETIQEGAPHIRPRVTGGDKTTALRVVVRGELA